MKPFFSNRLRGEEKSGRLPVTVDASKHRHMLLGPPRIILSDLALDLRRLDRIGKLKTQNEPLSLIEILARAVAQLLAREGLRTCDIAFEHGSDLSKLDGVRAAIQTLVGLLEQSVDQEPFLYGPSVVI